MINEGVKFSRASNKPEKPGVIPSKRDDTSLPSSHQPVKKLEDNRRLMLEQQLGENSNQLLLDPYTSTQINLILLLCLACCVFPTEKVHKNYVKRRTRQAVYI